MNLELAWPLDQVACAWRIDNSIIEPVSQVPTLVLSTVRLWLGVRFRKLLTILRLADLELRQQTQLCSSYARFRLPQVTSPEKPIPFLELTAQVRSSPSGS